MNQPLPLREQMKALEHLQELDLKIDRLKRDKNSLPGGLKSLDDSLNRVRQSLEAKKNAAGEIQKVQRQTEAAQDINRDRLTRANSKLESVQNSQEFQAITKELEQLKKLGVTLDEQHKKTAQELEAAEKEMQSLTTQMEGLQKDRESQATVVSGKNTQFDSEIGNLLSERGKLTPQVESRTLALYDRVRAARSGLGIVPAVGGRCKGCNMMVPPQLYNEVQKGIAVQSCPSCHRILYVPSNNPAQESGEGPNADNPQAG